MILSGSAVERLGLAFLIDRQNYAMGGRIDIKTNDIPQFAGEVGIVLKLELAKAVWLQTMRSPDPPDRAFTDANRHGHHQGRPMGRLDGRVHQRQRRRALGLLPSPGAECAAGAFCPGEGHQRLLP
jgi:hypothetical protein